MNSSKKLSQTEKLKAWAVLGGGCLAFLMLVAFNLNQGHQDHNRTLASKGQNSQLEKQSDFNQVIAKNLAGSLERQKTELSKEPTVEDQFLFGYLRGDYTSFENRGLLMSVKLKKDSKGKVISTLGEASQLMERFKKTYFQNSFLSLEDGERDVASKDFVYLLQEDQKRFRVLVKTDSENRLVEIQVQAL